MIQCLLMVTVCVLDPPILSGTTNGSQWVEIKTDANYSITCSVVDSNPPVTQMIFTYNGSKINNVNISNGTVNATLQVSKAGQNNSLNYTCEAKSPVATSYQVFQTFVGGKAVCNLC